MRFSLIAVVAFTASLPCAAQEASAPQTVATVQAAIDRHLSALDQQTEGRCRQELKELRHAVDQLIALNETASKDRSTQRQHPSRAREALAEWEEKRRSRAVIGQSGRPERPQGGSSPRRTFSPEDFPDPKAQMPEDDADSTDGPSLVDTVHAIRKQHDDQQKEHERRKDKEREEHDNQNKEKQGEAKVEYEDRLDKIKSSPEAVTEFIKGVEAAQRQRTLTSRQAAELLKAAREILMTRAQDAATDRFEDQIENATTVAQLGQLRTQIRNARQGGRISNQQATSLLGKADMAIKPLSTGNKPQ